MRPSPPPTNAVALSDSTRGGGDLSRLLGAEAVAVAAAPPAESTRFKLLGVMAGKPGLPGPVPGVALISIDGKPPRTFAAGARVDDQLVLQTLGLRSASLGPAQGPVAFVLEIPPLPLPATGTLDQIQGGQMESSGPPPAHQPLSPEAAMPPPPVAQPMQPPVPQSGEAPPSPGGPSMAPLEQPQGLGMPRRRDGANSSGR